MDNFAVRNLVEPLVSALVDLQLRSHREFDENLPDETYRLTIEKSRPKAVNERFLHHLEMAYGKVGPVRIVEENDLKYLFIEGPDFNVGLRLKKLDRDYRSSNIMSKQQRSLRSSQGKFSWHSNTYQLFLGYRDSGGLQPKITDIAITRERVGRPVEIIWKLWSDAGGVLPIQDAQPNLPGPKPAKVKVKRRKDSGSQEASN